MSIPTSFNNIRPGDKFKLKGCYLTAEGHVTINKTSESGGFNYHIDITKEQQEAILNLLNVDNIEYIDIAKKTEVVVNKNIPINKNTVWEVVGYGPSLSTFEIKEESSDQVYKLSPHEMRLFSRFTFL